MLIADCMGTSKNKMFDHLSPIRIDVMTKDLFSSSKLVKR